MEFIVNWLREAVVWSQENWIYLLAGGLGLLSVVLSIRILVTKSIEENVARVTRKEVCQKFFEIIAETRSLTVRIFRARAKDFYVGAISTLSRNFIDKIPRYQDPYDYQIQGAYTKSN